ncbi:MAG: PAS domain-containing sensor histidine kinase [bacterium]|nr:PAS domain-containing sensor histidine kinase [bacterium]
MVKKSKIDLNKYWSPAFNTMSEFVYLLDKGFNIIKVNKAVADFTKKDESSLIGTKCYKALYDVNKPLTKDCPYKRMLKSEKFETLELFIPHRKKWLNIRTNPIFDEKNNLIGGVTFSEDITDRKNTEKLLLKSEEEFRVTFENAKDAIFWADIEAMCIVKCNKAAGKLVERDVKEIVGKSHTILFPPEKIEIYNNMFRTHLKKGGGFDEPAEVITKSGKLKPILITSSLTTIGEQKIMWGIFHDISERKKTESALKESEEKFRTLAEESPNMIFINKKGKVIYANKKCEEVMGHKKDEFYSDRFDFMSTVEPKDHDKVRKAFIKHMRGENVPPYEYTLALKNGNKMEIIITTKLINYGGEKAILGIITDITERKQIEKMKDNLICDVSHSLKTPIAITAMALEVCKGAMQVNDLDQIRRSHAIAHSNIKKAHKDVNNILEIFTLETGRAKRQKNKKEKISLTSVINEILKSLSYLILDKGLKINIDIQENAKDVIISRKDAVILINNLLENSIKFTEKGSISIKSRLKGSEVEISVQDTGCGIEPKHINKVFDKFYKRHPAVDGSGLGLAICREIVNIYNGKIEARSKGKNQGTTIIVRLPKG